MSFGSAMKPSGVRALSDSNASSGEIPWRDSPSLSIGVSTAPRSTELQRTLRGAISSAIERVRPWSAALETA